MLEEDTASASLRGQAPVVLSGLTERPPALGSGLLCFHLGEETVKASSADTERPPVPLWTWLIVAAALAFFFEGTLLRK